MAIHRETVFLGFQIRSIDPGPFPLQAAGKLPEAVLTKNREHDTLLSWALAKIFRLQHLPKVNPTRTGDEFHASSLLTDSAATKPPCSAKSKPPTNKSTNSFTNCTA